MLLVTLGVVTSFEMPFVDDVTFEVGGNYKFKCWLRLILSELQRTVGCLDLFLEAGIEC